MHAPGSQHFTTRMKDVLTRITRYAARRDMGPTARELCDGIGVSFQSVILTLGRLQDRGYVRAVPGTSDRGAQVRRWAVTRKGEQWL